MKNFIKIAMLIMVASVLSIAGNKKIVVDLSKQEAYAYEGSTLIYKGWISSGQKKYRTPTGRYTILQKEKEHISNQWPKPNGGAKMPYMLRLTWSGIALHLGYTPNRPASHGCIRLKDGFAQKLFKWAEIGTKVIIKGKAPIKVARKGRGFTDYIALAKIKYKKRKLYRVSKKRYIAKREKLINYYAKFSHKKLNRLLRKNYKKRRQLLASLKYNSYIKSVKLRKLERLSLILKKAKSIKYKNRWHKRLVKKGHKRYKKVSLKTFKYNPKNYLYWHHKFGLKS